MNNNYERNLKGDTCVEDEFYYLKRIYIIRQKLLIMLLFLLPIIAYQSIYASEFLSLSSIVKGIRKTTIEESTKNIPKSFYDAVKFLGSIEHASIDWTTSMPILPSATATSASSNIFRHSTSSKIYEDALNKVESYIKDINLALKNKKNKSISSRDVKLFVKPGDNNVVLVSFEGLRGMKYGSNVIKNSIDLAKFLYDKAGLAAVPGEAFLINEKRIVLRIPLRVPSLKTGFEAIQSALLKLISK